MEERTYEDEISLRELIMVLINHWKMIVGITVIVTILGVIYAFVIADTVYESKIEGTISVPEVVATKYGEYVLPSTNTMDYLSLIQSERVLRQSIQVLDLNVSVERLSERIQINNEKESSVFSFVVSAESPENAKVLAETLTMFFVEEVNLVYKEKAVDFFNRQYFVESQSFDETEIRLQRELENTNALIETVEPTITLKKLVLSDPVYAVALAVERNMTLEDLSEEMMLEEVVNPHYDELQGKIISLQQQLDDLQLSKEKNDRYLAELDIEKKNLLIYRRESDKTVMTDGLLEVIQSRVLVNESASLPESPIAPKKMLILAVSLVLGGMIGVFGAFFKAYWNNEM
jgi:capsular polysaccharide biosynthesis protein